MSTNGLSSAGWPLSGFTLSITEELLGPVPFLWFCSWPVIVLRSPIMAIDFHQGLSLAFHLDDMDLVQQVNLKLV